MRGQGEIPGRKYVHDTLAWNYRITEFAAAIGRVQLGRADEILARRAVLAARYERALGGSPQVRRLSVLPGATHAWFGYGVRVPARDAVAESLRRRGIETRSLYPVPAYRQPIPEYADFVRDLRPHAEAASAEVINLPLFYEMTFEEVDDVAANLLAAIAECAHAGAAQALPST
jgi:perosamine synthetase